MHQSGLLLLARCPDPKTLKADLAPFHLAADGLTSTSSSGFVLLHEGQPLVLASASLLLPLLRQQHRERATLNNTSSGDLVPGSELHAVLAADGSSADGGNGSLTAPLQLLGLAEMPGVRRALLDLLAAPSSSPGGWRLGWLVHSGRVGGGGGSTAAAARDAAAVLEAACHLAVLTPTTAEGAAALCRHALPCSWPPHCSSSRLQLGQALTAVGAPFGCLAPEHFSSFVATGVLSAFVPVAPSSGHHSSDAGCSDCSSHTTAGAAVATPAAAPPAALLLSDLRCSPGMEGGPVFAVCPQPAPDARPCTAEAAAACTPMPHTPQQQEQRPQHGRELAGMLLPPLKGQTAHVEFALVAPAVAVRAAFSAVVAVSWPAAETGGEGQRFDKPTRASTPSTPAGQPAAAAASSTSPPPAPVAAPEPAAAAAALSASLHGVVAVAVGGAWASGVIVSGAGHILTNAHLLPALSAAMRPVQGPPGPLPGQLLQQPASAEVPAAPLRVLLPGQLSAAAATAGGRGTQPVWAAADLLYAFRGPLDLAVLQLQPRWRLQQHAASPTLQRCPWQHVELSAEELRPGQPVCVVGFPALSPQASPLRSPILTAGNLAKVVHLHGSGGSPAMLLTTAAVHSGASGGAVLDRASGKLLGLVTSNAKHTPSRGRRGGADVAAAGPPPTVLPHLNFSIPAAQLRPVVQAAQAAAAAAAAAANGDKAATSAATVSALDAWRRLDDVAAASSEMQLVWRLGRQGPILAASQQEQEQQRRSKLTPPGGGSFGGATPPAGLQQLLDQLQRQQQSKL